MVTKTTLKAVFAGCGLLATWLFVTPGDAPTASSTEPLRPSLTREPVADQLNAGTAKLRDRVATVPMRSTRNPFRFASPKRATPVAAPASMAVPESPPPALTPPPPPPFKLSGIAERNTPQGRKRTAVITNEGQLYVVAEGDLVAGRYTVITIDPDAAVLRDQNGTEIRLLLR